MGGNFIFRGFMVPGRCLKFISPIECLLQVMNGILIVAKRVGYYWW